MKLISMTDFIMNVEIYNDYRPDDFAVCYNYASFLKQPLKLEMFVPCDKDGNVLEKPLHFDEWYSELKKGFFHGYEGVIMERYLNAKEKVLFEGFEVFKDVAVGNAVINEKGDRIYLAGGQYGTIEDQIGKGLKLTESAIKQLL